MKLVTLTATIFLAGSTAVAMAADTTPGPVGKTGVPTAHPASSGRPSAILDKNDCRQVWKEASSGGDQISADQSTPYVLNFDMVDKDKSGKISHTEFKQGCKNGWIQAAGDLNDTFKRPSKMDDKSGSNG